LLSLETSKIFTKQGYNIMYTVSLLLYSMWAGKVIAVT